MTAAELQALALAFLVSRARLKSAHDTVNQRTAECHEIESQLIDALLSTGDEDSGTAITVDGMCLVPKEEYWDLPKGDRFHIHRLLQVAP